MRIFVIALGVALMLYGIITGNVAGNQMWDEVKQEEESERGMFSTAQIVGPVSVQGPRYDAVAKYRRLHPRDSKVKKLRNGQILTVVGGAVMVVGFFI